MRAHERDAPWWARAAEWNAAGLLLAYAVMLFAHGAPPSLTDYANWTYQGVLLHRHMLGLPDATHDLKTYPVPNSAATVAIGLLTIAMPWMIAAKTWLCVQLLLSFVALRHLLRTTGGSAALWVIVPPVVFLNVNFWYGFMNFELGICWVMLTASILLRREREEQGGPVHDLVLGVVLLLAFFTHMIPFCFAALLVLLYAVQTRRYRVLGQIVPAGVASVWYLAGRYLLAGNADGQAGMVSTVRSYSAAFWAYKVNSYLKSFGFINPGSPSGSEEITLFGRAVFVVLLGVNLALCAALGWSMVRAARTAFRERAGERFVWIGVLTMLPLYLLAPGTALGISDPGSRVLQVALALALVLCGRGGGRLRLAGVCATVLGMTGMLLFARLGFERDAAISDGRPLPHAAVIFAHVPNHDQDLFYSALDRGEMDLPVFPTGMFLNQSKEPSPLVRDGSRR